ncbi:hypothetical protein OG413_33660 [Streptomyces sp. NBC_01433]|uniref:hypothetical protein n=1 Tax=Streptomyces sp. NBC_01433 TaxID=2903864 RepID=UPI00224F4908|nr:hypothetical protein [Streptomyces sp. NBC_01433]MCX4680163.1 hypothetical protein [Streptomyces sp. NBC_01433]
MDRYEKTAHPEWWANPSTCLARILLRATSTANTGAWEAVFSPPFDHGVGENLIQLIDADSCFILRFDTSAVDVQAEDFDGVDRLRPTVIPEP